MRNIIIIHGSYGSPNGNWFQWLKKNLEKLGFQVFVPQFPIPPPEKWDTATSGHSLTDWLKTLSKYKKYINENTIFVSHSRGNVLLFHFLSLLNKPVSAVFLIAPWIHFIWYPKGWKKIDSFVKKPFNWTKIKKGSKYFEIFQSTNDIAGISIEEGEEIAKHLNAKINIVKNAGHFNIDSSKEFDKFPFLLQRIKNFLKNNS